MFARFFEMRDSFEKQARKSKDPAIKALGRYEALARRKRRGSRILNGNLPWDQKTYDEYCQLQADLEEAYLALFPALDASPDWIYCVKNRTVGDFFVKTVDQAVEGLAYFEARTKRGNLLKPKVMKAWMASRRRSIMGQLVPTLVGPRGMTVNINSM